MTDLIRREATPERPRTVSGSQDRNASGGSSPRELWAGRELLWNLTLRELRSKYKRSALGWAFSTHLARTDLKCFCPR